MKKCALVFLMLLLVKPTWAQEAIPLFDDTPLNEQQPQKPIAWEVNKIDSTEQKSAPAKVQRPRLGRDAEPLTSLEIAPFPNVTIDIDSNPTRRVKKEENKNEEPAIVETDLIKRDTPLNMTETAKNAAHEIMKEKIQKQTASLNRHDVSQFKVANIHFGMDPEEVNEELRELGYTLTRVEKSIPLFRTTYYDEVCRQKHKLILSDDIRRCILGYAEANEHHYVFRETYTRPQSRETIQVSYSSPDTMNLSFKIVYQNRGDNSLNSSRKNMAKKMQRHQDFWNIIFDTYGFPDENDKLLWGDMNTKYMQATMRGSAYDAYIVMEDRLIQDKDYEAAQNDFKTLRKPTAFTITGEIPETQENTATETVIE